MTTPIKTKTSHTASAEPTTLDLIEGEMAVNTADRKIFIRDDANTIVTVYDGTTTDSSITTIEGDITTLETNLTTHTHEAGDIDNLTTTIQGVVDSTGNTNTGTKAYRYWRMTVDSVAATGFHPSEIVLEKGGVQVQGDANMSMSAGSIGGALVNIQDELYTGTGAYWSSGAAQTITWDFIDAVALNGCRFAYVDTDVLTGFTIHASEDNSNWDTICTHTNVANPGIATAGDLYLFTNGVLPSAAVTAAPGGGAGFINTDENDGTVSFTLGAAGDYTNWTDLENHLHENPRHYGEACDVAIAILDDPFTLPNDMFLHNLDYNVQIYGVGAGVDVEPTSGLTIDIWLNGVWVNFDGIGVNGDTLNIRCGMPDNAFYAPMPATATIGYGTGCGAYGGGNINYYSYNNSAINVSSDWGINQQVIARYGGQIYCNSEINANGATACTVTAEYGGNIQLDFGCGDGNFFFNTWGDGRIFVGDIDCNTYTITVDSQGGGSFTGYHTAGTMSYNFTVNTTSTADAGARIYVT